MSEHPLDLSNRMLDTGEVDTTPNRTSGELFELAPGVSLIESFSHVLSVDTGEGLAVFDTSSHRTGADCVATLRRWSTDQIAMIVYTHGHLDHVGGSRAFAADAADRGHAPAAVVSHEHVVRRFERYERTAGYNKVINARQFGGAAPAASLDPANGPVQFVPEGTLVPDVTFDERLTRQLGDTVFEFEHALGETDDHAWTWIPEHKMVSAGDQLIWNFPNCGNPQKVQRYPLEWAASLRAMVACGPELFVPAHGLPILGLDRITSVLETVADTLETLVAEVLAAMNTGQTLDSIIHSVTVPDETLALPYMRPLYDEPEFVIRNIWRLFGGWWDGNPARLKPPTDHAVGAEVADLAGGLDALIARAEALSDAGDHRLACQIVEFATQADPTSETAHRARSAIYGARRATEYSLMSKGIFGSAASESDQAAGGEIQQIEYNFDIGTS